MRRQRGNVEKGTGVGEQERRALIRKWENTPSPNPEFKGITPKDAAKALLRRAPIDSRNQEPG